MCSSPSDSSSIEQLSGVELLNFLKTRYETRKRQVRAVEENEGQQQITDFFQTKPNLKEVCQTSSKCLLPDKEKQKTMAPSPKKSPRKPKRCLKEIKSPLSPKKSLQKPKRCLQDVEGKTPSPRKSPRKPRRGHIVKRIKLKNKTPVKAKRPPVPLFSQVHPLETPTTLIDSQAKCSLMEEKEKFPDNHSVNGLETPTAFIEPQATCFSLMEEKENIPDNHSVKHKSVSTSPNSSLAMVMEFVQKVKREAREVKDRESVVRKQGFDNEVISSEQPAKRRCLPQRGILTQKGLRV